MSKVTASLLIFLIAIVVNPVLSFGYYWFAFGLWPVSWKAIIVFTVLFGLATESMKYLLKIVMGPASGPQVN